MCNNFIFCKCCCKQNLDEEKNLTVLREKEGKKCEFCGNIYYEESLEKTQVDNYNDSDFEIEDVKAFNGYSLINLLENKNIFSLYFKYKNIFSWFCQILIGLNILLLIFSNILLKIQNIALNELYLDLLENKYTIDKCYKDLIYFILEIFLYDSTFIYSFFRFLILWGRKILKDFILIFPKFGTAIMNLLFSFKYLKPNYKYTKNFWLKTKEDNFRYFSCYQMVCCIIWMNELSQLEEGTEFLKVSGLLSISTLIYDFIILFFTIDNKKKKKPY